jgi:hypothetical protein
MDCRVISAGDPDSVPPFLKMQVEQRVAMFERHSAPGSAALAAHPQCWPRPGHATFRVKTEEKPGGTL